MKKQMLPDINDIFLDISILLNYIELEMHTSDLNAGEQALFEGIFDKLRNTQSTVVRLKKTIEHL